MNPIYATDIKSLSDKSNFSSCFIIKENEHFYLNEGDCNSQRSPCCSFNIALSLMGHMEGILISENEPVWEYEERYQSARAILKQKHYPTNWMKNSCSWFSQRLANELGKNTIQKYLHLFNYGNQDISGYTVNNPLPSFWLASSLKISPCE